MQYKEAIRFLFNSLPMYQRIGQAAYKADLNNTLALTSLLNNPQNKIKTIHIAGTNGKGSVSHIIASVLQEAGYKTGLYTSPHLKDFRERIKIDGKMIDKKYVSHFVAKYHKEFIDLKLSFFEMTVGLAFDYFAKQNVDYAVIETGLGGRLDSTNVIYPLVSIITNIDFDHTALLGNTLEKIASEKAGIIKHKTPVVIGQSQKDIQHIFINKADEKQATLYNADKNFEVIKKYSTHRFQTLEIKKIKNNKVSNYKFPLLGVYQKYNIITALQSLDVLKSLKLKISNNHIKKGINNTVLNTGLMGRWHILNRKPLTICDTAHNPAGLSLVIEQISELKFEKCHFVLGMVNDKEVNTVLGILPKNAFYYFCQPNIPRAMGVDELKSIAEAHGLNGRRFKSVNNALKAAKSEASEKDLIFVGNNTFVVAEVV